MKFKYSPRNGKRLSEAFETKRFFSVSFLADKKKNNFKMEIMCFGCTLYCLWSAMARCFSCASVTVNLNKTSWIMYCVQCFFASRSYFVKRWPAGFYSRILFLMENPKNDSERSENYYYSYTFEAGRRAWTFILFAHKNFTLFAIYALQDGIWRIASSIFHGI